MAEAVRPIRKKKKAKKQQREGRESFGIVEQSVTEKDKEQNSLHQDIVTKQQDIVLAEEDKSREASAQDLEANTAGSGKLESQHEDDHLYENIATTRSKTKDTSESEQTTLDTSNKINVDSVTDQGINTDNVRHEVINVDSKGDEGINADDEHLLEDAESENVDLTEEEIGTIEERDVNEGTTDARTDVDVVGKCDVEQEDTESSAEPKQQDGVNIDNEGLVRTFEGSVDEGIHNNERQDQSPSVSDEVSDSLNIMTDNLRSKEEGNIGEQTVYFEREQDVERLNRESKDLVGTSNSGLKTIGQSKEVNEIMETEISTVVTEVSTAVTEVSTVVTEVSTAVTSQMENSCQTQVMSEQSQSPENVTKERSDYGHIHNIFGRQKVSTSARETITAFTEDDLKSFYYNPALVLVEDSVDEFIKETLEPRRESEFYELLSTYQNTSRNLKVVKSDIESLRKKCVDKKNTIWSTETKTVTAQGMCKDLHKVSYTHSYEEAVFNLEQAGEMNKTLETLKSSVHETFTLAKYSCDLARIHIVSYIHELHAQSPVFCGVTQDSPIVGVDTAQVSHVVFSEIHHLRDCISVLFQFMRKPTEDEDFYNDVNAWLENLIALLLRVATLPDHVFILNHVLRCPPGVTRKLAHFIQPLLLPCWNASLDEYFWQHPLLNHFITMLANLLLPIKLREKYLLQMKSVLCADGSENSKTISWVMVDEDGEEDVDPDESWMLIPENDFVALFSQFSLDSLYKIIVGVDANDGSPDWESRRLVRKTAVSVMQVFAFSTCLIQMLGKAFTLYSIRRYREFAKRLGRAISTIVVYVSQYWAAYKTEYLNKYGDNEITFHLAFGSEYSLEKLQLEYDQFFIRASQQILSAHKLGVWQFLIDMPYYSLSTRMTWGCYRFLHRGTVDRESFSSLADYVSPHSEKNETASLLESFKTMTESEVVFLLTTFSNMARARTVQDIHFISTIVCEIYEVSYLDSGAADFLPKTGKDLLGSICQRHPFVMSMLLERVKSTLETVREECVALFQALPIDTWRPKASDIQTIRNWLLRSAVESSEHQLSRYLLTNINWQCQELDGDVLYLPQCVHRAVAILLVETCALRLSNRSGGIAVDVFKETPGILEKVTQMATNPIHRVLQHFTDQELYKWLWEVVMFLHLHQAECPASVMNFTNTPSTFRANELVTSSYDQSEFFANLSKPGALDLNTDEVLVNVLASANKDGPLACFVALQLSTYGHDPEMMSDAGLTYMSVILDEGHVFSTCRVIENTVPAFFTKELLAFAENSRFTRIIDVIIHSGARWREQEVLDILSGIIQKHVTRSSFAPDTNSSLIAVEFWLRAVCCLPYWNTDGKVVQVLNNLLKCVFRNSDGHELVVDYFVKKHEDTLRSLKDQGFLSSLFSFVISHPTSANLADINTFSQYVYFCYFVLCAESQYQEQCGLKAALANKLSDKPQMCIETALKKVSSSLKEVILIPSCNLDIYRWAELALCTDHDEPLLAIIWQKFFQQFLHRVYAGPGMPERGSVGFRFFESTANTTYLKTLKARLVGTAEHYKAKSVARNNDTDGEEYRTSEEVHRKLARLFQTLALWLDEPRLHDPTLFLQGLPPAYDAQRLIKIFKRNDALWLDCVDVGMIDRQLSASLQYWMKFNNERQKKICGIQKRNLIKKPNRVPNKMFRTDEVLEPPSFKILLTPIPESPGSSVLLDKYKIMETLGRNLDVLVDYARKFMMKLSTNSALDYEYMDMLQHIFENAETQLQMSIPCRRQERRKKGCSGAANLIIKFREKRLCEHVCERASRNREEYKILMREMLHEMPADICLNALCVEKTLTLLLKQCKSCQNPVLTKKFEDIGSSTFHMFIGMVSDPVRQFPPTMQFFSTCVELLGKTFIMDDQNQTEVLLRTILAHPKIVGLLLPIFQPNTCEGIFAEMYENIIQTSLDVEVKFSLLSKFDFRIWLTSKPTLSERMAMMKVLFAALCDCGFEPPVKTTMLSEIYLRKMNVLLLHQFPDLFGETLSLLVHGSADHALCVSAWNEFLITTKVLVKNMSKREIELNTTPPFLLQHDQVGETVSWLVEYFNGQRLSSTVGSNEGMFTLWKPYLPSLIALYEYISWHTIAAYEQDLAKYNIEVMKFLWNRISDFFSPWISPCQINSDLALPWSELETGEAAEFMDLYVRVLIFFQNFVPVPSNGKPSVLTLVWELYIAMVTKHSPPSYFSRVYHAKFTCLPWNVFRPNVSHLESMLQVCSLSGIYRGFLIEIFTKISWLDVLQRFRLEGEAALRQCQNRLFYLLLVLGNERTVIKTEKCEMLAVVEQAEKFDWDMLDGATCRAVCEWMVSNCNYVEILQPSSLIWNSIRLLQAASLLSSSVSNEYPYSDIPEKRLSYFNTMVKLLCKCSVSSEHAPGLYRPLVKQLMDGVLVASDSTTNDQNSTALYMEVLNLLNSLSPKEKVLDLALETIQEKILDLTERTVILAVVMAACRSLASVSLMVQVVEVGVETHFNNISLVEGSEAQDLVAPWGDVLGSVTVPELSQKEFVQECINHSAVLTLFAHTVQSLSQCQSAAAEFNMLKDLNAWTASIKPSNPDTESKVILLWYKLLQLIVRQINYDVNLRDLGQQIDFIIPYIAQAGEDRDTSGLLGVIGLGRKSALSASFRFLSRALSTFLSAQLPFNNVLRVKANAPGCPKSSSKKETSSDRGASQRTNTALHNLESLRLNKTYSDLVQHIEYARKFIVNPENCLSDGPQFLQKLTKDLFKDKSYLGLAV